MWQELVILCIVLLILIWILRRHQIKNAMYLEKTDISGKTVLITGASSGIGQATALELAKRGGRIYIPCRDMAKGKKVLEKIKHESNNLNVFLMQMDLTSLESIENFADNFQEREKKLDILIHNAGIIGAPKTFTKDGFEIHFATNHLGPSFLTFKLLDLLTKSGSGRIIIVSSMIHKFLKLDQKNLNGENYFETFYTYSHSKLMNILFARELAKRLEAKKITVNSLHPGHTRTNLMRNFNWFIRFSHYVLSRLYFRTPHEGAQTQIMLAVDPKVNEITGKYFKDCREATSSNASKNDEDAKWLFDETYRLLKDRLSLRTLQ